MHEDAVSIVEVGSTVYNTKVADFLEDEDDDIKHDPSSAMKFQSITMEQLRIVFDFNGFDPSSNTGPPILAIYHKRDGQWQQVFAVKSFNDPEIDMLCSGESMMDDVQQCDLSLLFKSLSKKQLILGIQSFLKKLEGDNGGSDNADHLRLVIPELKDLRALSQRDSEFIQFTIAQIVSQNEDILDEFNTVIDRDLESLVHDQFQRNLRDLEKDVFDESQWNEVFEDIENIVQKARSLSGFGQHLDALSLVESVCQQFLVDFLGEMDEDDREELRLDRNSKLNYRISDLETSMEKICKGINVNRSESARERLVALECSMKEWRKKLIPVFGPLFSDNIRGLNQKLQRKPKRKREEDEKTGGGASEEKTAKRQRVR